MHSISITIVNFGSHECTGKSLPVENLRYSKYVGDMDLAFFKTPHYHYMYSKTFIDLCITDTS